MTIISITVDIKTTTDTITGTLVLPSSLLSVGATVKMIFTMNENKRMHDYNTDLQEKFEQLVLQSVLNHSIVIH